MNADAFRHFYNYHFAENRLVWDHVASLSFEQFTQKVDYSCGSVREQLVHLLDAEDMWFSELRGAQPLEPLPETVTTDDRDAIRAHWDQVEKNIRAYLDELQDEQLFSKPIKRPRGRSSPLYLAGASPCGEPRHRSSCSTSACVA